MCSTIYDNNTVYADDYMFFISLFAVSICMLSVSLNSATSLGQLTGLICSDYTLKVIFATHQRICWKLCFTLFQPSVLHKFMRQTWVDHIYLDMISSIQFPVLPHLANKRRIWIRNTGKLSNAHDEIFILFSVSINLCFLCQMNWEVV